MARVILDAIEAGDIDALVAMGSPIEASCPVPRPSGLGGPYPLCDDATADGELRYGYVWSSGSEGGLANEERFHKDIQRLIDSNLRLLTIGCAVKPGTTNECHGDLALVFEPSPFGAIQIVAELAIRHGDASAPDGILGVLPVLVSGCDERPDAFRCELLIGGDGGPISYRHWGTEGEGQPQLSAARFFLWTG